MQYIIINEHLKDTIINQKLLNNQAIFDIELISLNSFINKIIGPYINPFELYLILDKLDLKILKSSLKEIDFLNELITNKELIDKYKLNIDDLDIHPEYKLCLKAMPSFNYDLLFKYLDNHDFSNYTIYDINYDLFELEVIGTMLKKGAKLESLSSNNLKTYKNISNNISDAIKSIATYIIDHNLDLNDIAIITSSENYAYLKIILKTFNINTNIKNYNYADKALEFISLLDFYIEPNLDNYLKIVSSSFKGQDNYEIINEYMCHHIDEFKLEVFNRFGESNDYYHDLEIKANEIHLKYIDDLNHLLNLEFDEAIIYIFDLIKDNSKTTLDIKNILETYKTNLKDSYFIYRPLILNLKCDLNEGGILVSDYHHDIYDKDYIFILNPDLNNYPGFKPIEGFINEDVLAKTNYLSLEKRYQNHLNHFNFLKNNKNVIYFLINSTLEGKSLEYDEYIISLDEIKIEIINNEFNDYLNYNHQLSKDNATKAFIKNHEIRGSISSFEKYFNCPYSYFLNYGLGLYDPNKFELGAALVGTIIHEVFENLVKDKSKEYYLDYENILDDTLNKYQTRLNYIFPNDYEFIKASFIRIKESIELEMIFIEDMEKDTSFIPSKTEYRFDYNIIEDEDTKLHLRGIIDRIDTYVNEFRIIDYKTSIHNLNKVKIAKGLQLQLLTYAIIYETIFKDNPSSTLYLNIKHGPDPINEFSFSKKTGVSQDIIDEDKLRNNFIADHKLKGLVFNDTKDLDHTYKHINTRKKDAISSQYLIDYDKTKTLILNIYQYLIKSLKDGKIDLKPSEDACTWCNYHRICHYKGIKKDRDIICDINIGIDDETE